MPKIERVQILPDRDLSTDLIQHPLRVSRQAPPINPADPVGEITEPVDVDVLGDAERRIDRQLLEYQRDPALLGVTQVTRTERGAVQQQLARVMALRAGEDFQQS